MTEPDIASAASRLCAECGLCCNGAMFHMVQLQPGDSPVELAALGLKLKRKKGRQYILQPCPAHRESRCSIYTARPERCRLFECRQLKRVAAGEITEAMALANIREVKRRVLHLNELLKLEGAANIKQPLSKRCEKVLGEPLVASSDRETVEKRNRFTRAMQELDAMLDQDFRPEPKGAAGLPGTDFLTPQLANTSSRSVTAK